MKNTEVLLKLEDVLASLKTGDLVFFQGVAADSVLIRNLTGGQWSHVAIIVEGEHIGYGEHRLLLFESSARVGIDIDNTYNSKADGTKAGVMLSAFVPRMEGYIESGMYTLFGIRRLNRDRSASLQLEKLKEFVLNQNIRKSVYPSEYEVATEHFVARELDTEEFSKKMAQRVKGKLVGVTTKDISDEDLREIARKMIETVQDDFHVATTEKIRHDHNSPSHFFCSELVADLLMHVKVIDNSNAARFSPNDLSDQSEVLGNDKFDESIYIPGNNQIT